MKWLDDPNDLAEAMELVPFADAFVKGVKAAVKSKLEEDPDCIPGFKLRGGGHMTSYEAREVAKIIMEAKVMDWDDLMSVMKFSMTPFITVWSDHTGMSKAEAKKDLIQRFKSIAKTKPKSPSVMKDKSCKTEKK